MNYKFELIFICLIFGFIYKFSYSETIIVNQDIPSSFTKIQEAVNNANDADMIIVYPGIYHENIFLDGKNLHIKSINRFEARIIGSLGAVITFAGTENENCIIEGFYISHSESNTGPIDENNLGSGIDGQGCTATIKNNYITRNISGGIWRLNGSIFQNTIAGNSNQEGGALSNCNGSIYDNRIMNNQAEYGGGFHECNGLIYKNFIFENLSDYGGAFNNCGGNISKNNIERNRANKYGGAFQNCDGNIHSNKLYFNRATGYIIIPEIGNPYAEAGIGGSFANCDGFIYNNVIDKSDATVAGGITQNSFPKGSAFYNCSADIINNTLLRSTGILTFNTTVIEKCTGVIKNNIFWQNEGKILEASSTPSYTLGRDPLFIEELNPFGVSNARLSADSPAIDAGGTVTLNLDIIGVKRPINGTNESRGDGSDIDIGAFEFFFDEIFIQDQILDTKLNELETDQENELDLNNDTNIDIGDIIKSINFKNL